MANGSRFGHLTGCLLAVAVALCLCGCGKPVDEAALRCYVGGTMRPAMEELIDIYEKETGQAIELDYGDSGSCLVKIETTGKGDLYVAHDPFLNALEIKKLGRQGWAVAAVTPMIAVPKGNPKNIRGLEDLAREGIKLGLTDETYSTMGHILPVMFKKTAVQANIEKNIQTRTRSGGEVANSVSLGHLDAAIVWNAVIHARRDKLDAIPIENRFRPDSKVDVVTSPTFGEVDMSYIRVTIATLKCSKRPKAATKFAEFVNSPRGRAVFARHGFSPARSGQQAGGSLLLYCAAASRPPAAEIIKAFNAETGVKVEVDYSGSGVLLSRMKLSGKGDLYMPGDVKYIEQAKELGLIASQKSACCFVPVILVQKGNPKGIKTLQDLTRPGIRLGLGNPDACAIGKSCERIFKKNNIDRDALKKNLVFQSVTVNELGVQIKTGQLDATIVWDAIAAYYSKEAEAVAIPPEQNEISPVGIAVLSFSKNKDLSSRFAAFVAGEKGKTIFRKHNYTIDIPK